MCKVMLHGFELGHNVTQQVTKNICCTAEGEGVVDHSIVTQWFLKFPSGRKNLNDQVSSSRTNTIDSEWRTQNYM